MNTPQLKTIASSGPKRTTWIIEGQRHVHERYTPCDFCEKRIEDGAEISFFRGEWLHAACATKALLESEAHNAWLALGADMARHPRAYSAAETKVILNQLMRIASAMAVDAFEVDEPSAPEGRPMRVVQGGAA
ncbi:MAG: hypothetical protein ABW022_07195 [Actinoplanes sp.]